MSVAVFKCMDNDVGVRAFVYGMFVYRLCFCAGVICLQVEKVVLFFLSKQGELAQSLLDAHQALKTTGGGGGSEDYFIGNGGGDMPAGGAGAHSDRYSIYCGIGRQIAELMRFLQLNGGLG